MKANISIKLSLKFVPKDLINNITALLQISDFEVRIFGLFYDAILLIDDMANISQLTIYQITATLLWSVCYCLVGGNSTKTLSFYNVKNWVKSCDLLLVFVDLQIS